MSFHEKYLIYKNKYIQLKTESSLIKNNNWIGGNDNSNVEFKICKVKINCSNDTLENPFKDIEFSNSKISKENINKLFEDLKKFNLCNLPIEEQTKIMCKIFKMIESNFTYDNIIKYIRELSISNKIGGDVSKKDETFINKFKDDLTKTGTKEITYIAEFEIIEEVIPIYKGTPQHMIERITDVYKKQDLTNLNKNIDSNILLLSPSKNVYSKNHEYYDIAESVIDLPFFDYVPLIQNAQEIHLIGSAFSGLSKFVALEKTKKCLHNYNNCGLSTNFFKNWYIINN